LDRPQLLKRGCAPDVLTSSTIQSRRHETLPARRWHKPARIHAGDTCPRRRMTLRRRGWRTCGRRGSVEPSDFHQYCWTRHISKTRAQRAQLRLERPSRGAPTTLATL